MVDNFNDIGAEEVVLLETRPNKISDKRDNFYFKLLLIIVFSSILFFFTSFFGLLFQMSFILIVLLPIPFGIFLSFFVIKKLTKGYNNKVKITNKGIYIHEAITNKLIKIPFSKIRNFSCQQGSMDKKVNCADIKINTVTNQYFLPNINEYREVSRIISENACNLEPEIIIGEEIGKKVTSDEKILWEGKEKTTVLYAFFAIVAVFCFVGSLYILFTTPNENIADVKQIVFIGFFISVFFILFIYFGIKNDKQTYYIVTDKRLIYCDVNTDGTCKEIPLETIEQCFYFHNRRSEPSHIQIITQEKRYKLQKIDNKRKIASLINKAIKARKRALQKQKSNNIK